MPFCSSDFSHRQLQVYEAHRDVDLYLERGYRACDDGPFEQTKRVAFLAAHMANVSECAKRLVICGVNPNAACFENGLESWLAHAFSEFVDFTLDVMRPEAEADKVERLANRARAQFLKGQGR